MRIEAITQGCPECGSIKVKLAVVRDPSEVCGVCGSVDVHLYILGKWYCWAHDPITPKDRRLYLWGWSPQLITEEHGYHRYNFTRR